MQINTQEHHAHHRIGHSLFLVGAFLLILVTTMLSPVSTYRSEAFGVSELTTLSNEARIQLNKRPLTANAQLMNAAQIKAEDMVKKQYFAHTAPDGTSPWEYFKKVSYSYSVAGENLAITNENAKAVIDGWLNSPTHRDNLLSGDYADFGIGMAAYGDYQGHKNTYVIVAFYGRATDKQALTAPTNPSGTASILQPNIATLNPTALIIGAIVLMVGGILLEVRHIRRLHHKKSLVA